MNYECLRVDLGARSYDILIGDGLLADAALHVAPHLSRNVIAIVTEETVAAHYLEPLRAHLEAAGLQVAHLVLPAGEATKSWAHVQQVVEWLLAEKIERDDLVIALGGGVIGDLVGFAAAILRRGIGFVQMPTSLLAQVDSSVGGKTGINSPHGKNLVGAFHQPKLVLADVSVFDTLTQRDLIAGYGEVVKYGLLGDAEFFGWLEGNADRLVSGDRAARIHVVRRSCEMKAGIVARDEEERGERALLNLGHTFGHALEAATGYSDRLLHGEGVAIGCALAFETSQRLGLCPQEAPSRVRAHLKAMGMKTDLADIDGDLPDADGLIALMGQDKKVRAGHINFIMARDIGAAFVATDVDLDVVREVLADGLSDR
jgi:3-dehydroquinate synthase